jgi:hypothetical protein
MKFKKHILILSCFSFVLCSYKFAAQTPNKLSEKQILTQKKDYAEKAKSLGILVKPEYFYKYKININKISEFKSIGLDLVELGNKAGELTYKEYSLVSDAIVEGTVVERTYNQNKNAFFHTTYKIRVESVIKGSIVEDYIYIKTESGMVGDDSYVKSSTEPDIFIGEKVLFMLNKVDIESIKSAKEKGHFDKSLNAISNDFTVKGKFTLKEESFFDAHKHYIGKKDKVFSTINKIQSINDEKMFHNKKFK